jgi:hypothetical protein
MKRIIRKGTNGIGNRFKEYVFFHDGVILIKRLIFVSLISSPQYLEDQYLLLKVWDKDCIMVKSFSIKVNSIKEIFSKLDIK